MAKITLSGRSVPAAFQRIADAHVPVSDDAGRLLVQPGGHRSLIVDDDIADDVAELLADLVVEGEREPKPKAAAKKAAKRSGRAS